MELSSAIPRRIWCYCPFPLARERISVIRDVSALLSACPLLLLTYLLLHRLSNEKPSAIFRLRGTYTPNTTATQSAFTSSSNSFQSNATNVTAVLGFSIEPLAQIQEQVALLPSSNPAAGILAKPAADPTLLAERIVKNLFNYVSGFAEGSGMGMGGGIQPGSRIEMAVIARWYEKFVGKIRNGGVGFLERDE